jgi:DNA topoisomerase I
VLAAVALAAAKPSRETRAARERAVTGAIETVAVYLGNTPAVCRASYVDPRVIDSYLGGETIAVTRAPDLSLPRTRRRVERAVLELLTGQGSA